jgi:hypothetical protein
MRTSHKAKDAAAEKQSYVCDTFTGALGHPLRPAHRPSPRAATPVVRPETTATPHGPTPCVVVAALSRKRGVGVQNAGGGGAVTRRRQRKRVRRWSPRRGAVKSDGPEGDR